MRLLLLCLSCAVSTSLFVGCSGQAVNGSITLSAPSLVKLGLFQTGQNNLTFGEANEWCQRYGEQKNVSVNLATMEQLNASIRAGFQTCQYGWVASTQLAMPRNTSSDKCGNGGVGAITKGPCFSNSVFCKPNFVVQKGVFLHITKKAIFYKNVSQVCLSVLAGSVPATFAQVQDALLVEHHCWEGWIDEGKRNGFRWNASHAYCYPQIIAPISNYLPNVICYNEGLKYGIYQELLDSSVPNNEAQNSCAKWGASLANEGHVEGARELGFTTTIDGWIAGAKVVTVDFVNGTNVTAIVQAPCINNASLEATAFCHSWNISNTEGPPDKTWVKIVMGSILATIFVIMLASTFCNKGFCKKPEPTTVYDPDNSYPQLRDTKLPVDNKVKLLHHDLRPYCIGDLPPPPAGHSSVIRSQLNSQRQRPQPPAGMYDNIAYED
uniref:Uncharacterized protein LOC116939997 n=1 Tax=Petromyzon marinus TaxID=7757 RepID=A0AAJ7SUK4_PETMA|nr:uncharacterized protein LOC116939997 [Petromyzon marinus]